MPEITKKTLDIEKILASKLGSKSKYVPTFLVNYLNRIVHVEELNEFLWSARDKTGSPWLRAALERLDITTKIIGVENLPSKDDPKRYTFVSNHPLGGIDGVSIGAVIGEHYDDNFRYLVNDLLMNLPGLAPLCIPINKTGKQSRDFPEMVRKGFASNYHMVMFPAGLCSRLIDGKIQDIEWSKTFIQKSVETHRDIVPIHFEGHNSKKFYRIAKLCKLLHLKVNIAMLYLSDEMFKNQHQTFTITIGKPIPWQTFDNSQKPRQWAQWVRSEVYSLKSKERIKSKG